MDTTTIDLLKVTKDLGATLKPGPAVFAGPGQVCTDGDFGDISATTGLNGPMVADLLSAMAAHENLGTNLYRMLGRTSDNPALIATFNRFEADAVAAVGVYRRLFDALDVPWRFVSPAARMTEAMDAKLQEAFLLAGSADPVTVELKRVEAVLLASTLCVANTAILRSLGDELDAGPIREAIAEAVAALEGSQQEHLEWAAQTQRTMAVGQAKSALKQRVAMAGETVVGTAKDAARAVRDALT
jgi:hypothetical protein